MSLQGNIAGEVFTDHSQLASQKQDSAGLFVVSFVSFAQAKLNKGILPYYSSVSDYSFLLSSYFILSDLNF